MPDGDAEGKVIILIYAERGLIVESAAKAVGVYNRRVNGNNLPGSCQRQQTDGKKQKYSDNFGFHTDKGNKFPRKSLICLPK